MNPATLEFLKQRFSTYYNKPRLKIPPALEQREWGFIFFDSSENFRMRRHMAFSSEREVFDYLSTMIPRHVYYSTAYYALPSAATMKDKVWSGADLIFDLDADHIVRGDYGMMLARVKEEVLKLIHMLSDELGFKKSGMQISFSGGRGYHIHIRDIEVCGWGSAERRELVDYVCGIGIDPKIMLGARSHPPEGWPLRYREALIDEMKDLQSMGSDEAKKKLMNIKGIGDELASKCIKSIATELPSLQNHEHSIPVNHLRPLITEDNGVIRERLRDKAALTDEPVTTDIKRLIRMPGSLHGGSGFRVTPLTVSEIEGFDPLIDAVVFGETEINVDLSIDLTMPLLGNTYELNKGINTVPEALAVFLCCRGLAEITGGKK